MVNANQAIVDRATAAITKAATVEQGAKILIATLKQVVADNKIDSAPLNAVLDGFDADTSGLADALVENTPSAPDA